MIAHPRSIAILGLGLTAVLSFALPGRADQRYVVSGHDTYVIGGSELRTNISYSGTQQLTIKRFRKTTRFTAQAQYFIVDEAGKTPARATFVQILMPSGELRDQTDLDPDYLTVLNQPFAIELDASTLSDLLHLSGTVPFDFPAPMAGGGTLHGTLQRGPTGPVSSMSALGVRFDAAGPMTGPLPDRALMTINGKMHMRGIAYYALTGDPLLLALDETLTISGHLRRSGRTSTVTIEYRRTIKAISKNSSLSPNPSPSSSSSSIPK